MTSPSFSSTTVPKTSFSKLPALKRKAQPKPLTEFLVNADEQRKKKPKKQDIVSKLQSCENSQDVYDVLNVSILKRADVLSLLEKVEKIYVHSVDVSQENGISDKVYDAIVTWHDLKYEPARYKRVGAAMKTKMKTSKTAKKKEPAKAHQKPYYLPFHMSSLDKIKENDVNAEKNWNKWIDKHIDETKHEEKQVAATLTYKADGMAICIFLGHSVGEPPQFFTQGNGKIGFEINRFWPYFKFGNAITNEKKLDSKALFDKARAAGITRMRGEIIFTHQDFRHIQLNRPAGLKEDNKLLNARSAVVGTVNSGTLVPEMASRLSVVVYEMWMDNDSTTNGIPHSQQLATLENLGFQTTWIENIPLNKHLTFKQMVERTKEYKKTSPYAIDGLVYQINNVLHIDDIATKKFLHPPYPCNEVTTETDKIEIPDPKDAIAFKVDDPPVEATVSHVSYDVSKFACLNPVVHLKEATLVQNSMVSKMSGKSSEFIVKNKIGAGARILVSLNGSVIPGVFSVLQPAPNGGQLPDSNQFPYWKWSESKKEIYIDLTKDQTNNHLIEIQQWIHFFDVLGCKHMGPETITSLYQYYKGNLYSVLTASVSDLIQIPGIKAKKADNIVSKISKCTQEISLSNLLLSSCCFGEGFSSVRIQDIVAACPNILQWRHVDPETCNVDLFLESKIKRIQEIEGISSLAKQFVDCLPIFYKWYDKISSVVKIKEEVIITYDAAAATRVSTLAVPKSICITGVRDADINIFIKQHGGKVSAAVTKKTELLICKSKNSGSKKEEEALKNNIPIVTLAEFKQQFMI